MRKYCVFTVYVLTLVLMVFLAGCSGGGGINIAFPSGLHSGSQIDPGSTPFDLSASGAATINWTLTSGAAPAAQKAAVRSASSSSCGSLGASQTSSGQPVTYTPGPVSLTASCMDTITASDAANPSRSKSITIINGAITVSAITTTGGATPPASMSLGGAAIPLSATANNDVSGGSDITWAANPPSGCGTLGSPSVSGNISTVSFTPSPGSSTANSCNVQITATSTNNGSASTPRNIAILAPATHFTVSAASPQTAGTQFQFTVTALDANGFTATGYSGTVHFTSSDGQAVLPANTTLTNGTGNFNATLKTAGTETITATDSVTSSITGASGNITVNPAAAAAFTVSAVSPVTAGAANSFMVTAKDAYGNTATGYSGTVHFTSSDGQAVLPANSTLTSGTGSFNETLKTAGTKTITATDTVTSTITGTSNNITVNPAAASTLVVSAPAAAAQYASFSVTVTAKDTYNNTATGYAGTVHFTSSDGSATLPSDATLSNGTANFNATLATTGSQTITATDTVTSSITGTSGAITVSAAVATHIVVSASSPETAGSAFSVTVTAEDATNHTATGYAGTVHFTSADGQAVLPANSTLTNGTAVFSATLKTAGTQTITATDTVTSSITGTSNNITVNPAAASKLKVTVPVSATQNVSFNFTVTAQDPYNNTDTNYAGTVHFTSSDGSATLPANATLTSGTGSFSATLATTGSQTITATDTVTSSITGTSGGISVTSNAATHFSVTPTSTSQTQGAAFNVTVTALDASNSTATGYTGTVHFTSSDSSATLPADSTLTNGTGTFPVTLNTGGSQTVTATDTVTSSITGTTSSITVASTGVHNSELNGNYAFRAAGYNQQTGAFYTVTGAFHANGDGTISGGEEDILTLDAPASGNVESAIAINSSGSTYSVLADNRGTLTLVTSKGTQTFAIAVGGIGTNNAGVAANGRLIGTNLGLVISGEFLQQTVNLSSVNFTGSYAFVGAGTDGTSARFGVAGETSLSGSAGSSGTGSGELDVNTAGNLDNGTSTPLSFTESYGAPDSYGRSAVTNIVSVGGGNTATIHMAQYAVTANEGYLIGTDGVTTGDQNYDLYIARAFLRSGSFSNSTLNGKSVMFQEGTNGSGSTANVGLLTTNGSGGFSITIDQNHGGSVTLGSSITGANYSVTGSTGRVTLSSAGSNPPLFYLVSSNKSVMLGTDGKVEIGMFEPQTATTLSGAFTFGSHPPADFGASAEEGVVTLSSGTATGTSDDNSPDGSGNSVVSTGNAISNTTYTIDGNGHITITDTSKNSTELVGYVVSSSKAILIEDGALNTTPTVGSTEPAVTTVQKQ